MAQPAARKEVLAAVRKQALYESLSAIGHYQQFAIILTKMQALANGPVDSEEKDRFSMLSALADKHWRVVDRYLPTAPSDTSNSVQNTVSALQRAVLKLAASTQDAVVPTNTVHDDAVPDNVDSVMISSVIPADSQSVADAAPARDASE